MTPSKCRSGDATLTFLLVLMTSSLMLSETEAFRMISGRSGPKDGPPTKPEHFRSADELNKYLSDLTEYYTVLGRPRFGKRYTFDDLVDEGTRYRRDVSNDILTDSQENTSGTSSDVTKLSLNDASADNDVRHDDARKDSSVAKLAEKARLRLSNKRHVDSVKQ